MRLQFAGVRRALRGFFGPSTSFIGRPWFTTALGIAGRHFVFAASLLGSHNPSFEITGFSSSRNGRFALIRGSAQLGIIASFLNVFRLRSYRT